jgi:PTH1 family peptidyl-tRNA hydrolase
MKIIVGLGNPGAEYARTPHNAGFMLVDYLVEQFALPLRFDAKFKAAYAKGEVVRNGLAQDVFLIEPQTFMNESGVAVRALLDYFYKGILDEDEGNHLIVAHDDLDLPLGSFKLQKGKGPKVHNGLLSIYQHLGHKNFWHLRLGVDGRGADRSLPGRDYLLKPYDQADRDKMQESIKEVTAQLFS